MYNNQVSLAVMRVIRKIHGFTFTGIRMKCARFWTNFTNFVNESLLKNIHLSPAPLEYGYYYY